jgi:hypothetical protein
MPMETAIELLFYLAENEEFPSVKRELVGGISVSETRQTLREIAVALSRDETSGKNIDALRAAGKAGFTAQTRKVISGLSTDDTRALFSAFKLLD